MNANITNWSDVNVAYQVAKLGTVSAAAEALNVNQSTVSRRINALESDLGIRLFHRHARGFTVTEAGKLLMQVAGNTQDNFDRMLGQLQGKDTQLNGPLTITTVVDLIPVLIPIVAEFQALYPKVEISFAAESRVFKLEHAEAHISIRPGSKPKHPDYIAQPLPQMGVSLFASEAYIAKHGLLEDLNNITGHYFISTIDSFSRIAFMH